MRVISFGDFGINLVTFLTTGLAAAESLRELSSAASADFGRNARIRRLTGDACSRPTYISEPTNSATDTKTAASVNCRVNSGIIGPSVLHVDDLAHDECSDDLQPDGSDQHLLAQRVVEHQRARLLVDGEQHQPEHRRETDENPAGQPPVRRDDTDLALHPEPFTHHMREVVEHLR